MLKMICFHHDDLDGRAAAFAVKRLCDGTNGEAQFEAVSMNYGKPFPIERVSQGDEVWIVDFSIEPREMDALLAVTGRVIWIDHHKTAIAKYAEYPEPLAGARQDGVAGCVLTWQYCFPEIPVPRAIELVGDRDVWAWKYGQETANFYFGSGQCDTSPESVFWPTVLNDTHQFQRVLDAGATINGYRKQYYHEVLGAIGFEGFLDGHRCLCMNVAKCGSEVFGDAIKEYDICSAFYFDGQQYVVSLYSEKIDVSEIAKARGGGGHKVASGFQCAVLPYETSEV